MIQRIERQFAGRTLSVEVGRMAKLAHGSCLVQYGDTVVLCAATVQDNPTHLPLFPMTVEYREKQYAAGKIGEREYINYTDEPGVASDSNTETYAAIRLNIDNWRWHGVPFYLRTGKAMNRKLTQIVVYFKPTPHSMFRDPETGESSLVHNRLTINVQPDEGIKALVVRADPTSML